MTMGSRRRHSATSYPSMRKKRISWQPLPTAVYCRSKKAMASIAERSGVLHLHLPWLYLPWLYLLWTCQSKKAGVLPDIMNMLGGLTSPWLKVCGLEESSSWTHAKSSTMALPMAKACTVG